MKSGIPVSFVERAVDVAMRSPCRSKRGVVIAAGIDILSTGFNHQPAPFLCDGSEECKLRCGKTAVHAEQSAILGLVFTLPPNSWMLHVKAKDGEPCASLAPSCLECSKLILFSGIEWMYLLHDPSAQLLPGAEKVGAVRGLRADSTMGDLEIRRYSAVQFHYLTAEWYRIKLLT